jgi:hypothetical protein
MVLFQMTSVCLERNLLTVQGNNAVIQKFDVLIHGIHLVPMKEDRSGSSLFRTVSFFWVFLRFKSYWLAVLCYFT